MSGMLSAIGDGGDDDDDEEGMIEEDAPVASFRLLQSAEWRFYLFAITIKISPLLSIGPSSTRRPASRPASQRSVRAHTVRLINFSSFASSPSRATFRKRLAKSLLVAGWLAGKVGASLRA